MRFDWNLMLWILITAISPKLEIYWWLWEHFHGTLDRGNSYQRQWGCQCLLLCWHTLSISLFWNFLKKLSQKYSRTLKVIQCNNAEENVTLATTFKREGLGINFEFTAPETPQHNSVVERAFATLFGRVRAMLNKAKFPESLRKDICTKCANTATKHWQPHCVWQDFTLPSFPLKCSQSHK